VPLLVESDGEDAVGRGSGGGQKHGLDLLLLKPLKCSTVLGIKDGGLENYFVQTEMLGCSAPSTTASLEPPCTGVTLHSFNQVSALSRTCQISPSGTSPRMENARQATLLVICPRPRMCTNSSVS
jgi:hypothetical protein